MEALARSQIRLETRRLAHPTSAPHGDGLLRFLGGLLLMLAALAGCTDSPPAQHQPLDEDFSRLTLDADQWTTCQWPVRSIPGACKPFNTAEIQWYLPNEYSIEGGTLKLWAKKQEFGGRNYTSGMISTYGRRSFGFGRFEVRFQAPSGSGFWPAIWLAPADGSWPPEIDILEMDGSKPNTAYFTLHHGLNGQDQFVQGVYEGPDFMREFHTVTLDWSKDRVIWGMDGVERFRISEHIPAHPMYLIVNLAVGGGGTWPPAPDESTSFPGSLIVDYIRYRPLVERTP